MKSVVILSMLMILLNIVSAQENRIKVKAQNDIPAHFTTNPLTPKLEGQRIIPRSNIMYIFSETEISGQKYVIVKIGSQRGIIRTKQELQVEKNQFYLVKKEDLVRSTSPVNKKLQLSSSGERFYWETLSDIHVYGCDFADAGLPTARLGKRDWLPEGTGFVTVGKMTQVISNEPTTLNDNFTSDRMVNVYIIKLVNYRHEKNLDKIQREILYTKFAQFSVDPFGVSRAGEDSIPASLTKFYYVKAEVLEEPNSRKVFANGWPSKQLSFGILTLPIKMRLGNKKDSNDDPNDDAEDIDFDFSTDFSVGPFVGMRMRVDKIKPWYYTFGGTFALTFVSINSTTDTLNRITSPENVPAVTMAFSPLILEFDKFQIGTAFGIDIVGKDNQKWTYNKKPWFSFAIGYDFLKPKEESSN